MGKYEDMSNNQIITEISNLQAEYEATKMKMLKDLDKLDVLEEQFKEANEVLIERLKGKK